MYFTALRTGTAAVSDGNWLVATRVNGRERLFAAAAGEYSSEAAVLLYAADRADLESLDLNLCLIPPALWESPYALGRQRRVRLSGADAGAYCESVGGMAGGVRFVLAEVGGAAQPARSALCAGDYLMRFALRPSLFRPEFVRAASSLKFFGFWHALPVSEAYVHRSVEKVPAFLSQFKSESTIQLEFRVSPVAAKSGQ